MDIASRYAFCPKEDPDTQIVLLQGRGCFWKKCSFCNYYLDTADEEDIIKLNEQALSAVRTGTERLTVLNSGSWFELPDTTQRAVLQIMKEKGIHILSTEAHWRYRSWIQALRHKLMNLGIELSARIGVETFDETFREEIMRKGMGKGLSAEQIAEDFQECCLLFGLQGQSFEQLKRDLDLALSNFDRVYLNLYSMPEGRYPADQKLIKEFLDDFVDKFKDKKKYPGLIVLAENTDLEVG